MPTQNPPPAVAATISAPSPLFDTRPCGWPACASYATHECTRTLFCGQCRVCEVPLRHGATICQPCHQYPAREPGVCVTCGGPAPDTDAQCWQCAGGVPVQQTLLH